MMDGKIAPLVTLSDGRVIRWLTTAPHPTRPAHTHGMDAGQVGWRLHGVAMTDAEEKLPTRDTKRFAALCGMRPANGWGLDLFIDQECSRCVRKLAELSPDNATVKALVKHQQYLDAFSGKRRVDRTGEVK